MEFKDFDNLSTAGKMEAMRAGNSLVIALDQMAQFVQDMAPYLQSREEILQIERIGTLHEDIKVFSVHVTPVLQYRKAE